MGEFHSMINIPTDKPVYITSDIHAYHKNLCKGSSSWSNLDGCRDFKDQFEMTDKVVENINSMVGEDDILFHLGDWSFGGIDNVVKLRERIRCKHIIHIFGNHDHNIRQHKELQNLFDWCGDYLEIRLFGTNVVMCHYPIASWNGMGDKSQHYFGHVHNNFPNHGRSKDVGLDTNNLFPYNLKDLVEEMKKIPVRIVDHH